MSRFYVSWGEGVDIHPSKPDIYTVQTYHLIGMGTIDISDEGSPSVTISTIPVKLADDTSSRRLPFHAISNNRCSLYLVLHLDIDDLQVKKVPPKRKRDNVDEQEDSGDDSGTDGQQDGKGTDDDEKNDDKSNESGNGGKGEGTDDSSADEKIYPLHKARQRAAARAPDLTERARKLKERKSNVKTWISAAFGKNDTVRAIQGIGTNRKGRHPFKTLCEWVKTVHSLMTPTFLRDLPDPATPLPSEFRLLKNKHVYWETLFNRDTTFLTMCRKCADLIEQKSEWQSFLEAEEEDKQYGVSSLFTLLKGLSEDV